MSRTPDIPFSDFLKVDIQVGTIVKAAEFPEAHKPAIKMWIDFGDPVGTRTSSAQIASLYSPDDLPGRQVLAVVNFPPRQIGPFISEVLTLGFETENGIVLVQPDRPVPDGIRLA